MKMCIVILLLIVIVVKLILITCPLLVVFHASFINPEWLNAISSFLLLIVTACTAFYGYCQYENHKKEERTKLLCEYNKRYASDPSIKKVVSWIAKNLDKEGEYTGYKLYVNPPTLFEKEMFMRFYEELKLQIDEGNIKKEDDKKLFSYYAIKFYDNPDFHKNIDDYNKDCWKSFRDYCDQAKPNSKQSNGTQQNEGCKNVQTT